MKRRIAAAITSVVLLFSVPSSGQVHGGDEFDETQTHPLRVAAYLVHPVGFALEWMLFRPLHYVVSRPGLDKVFGHRPHGENRMY